MTDTKVLKIKALVAAGSTEGERSAAQSALNRVTREVPLRITATVINIDRDETFYAVCFTDVEGRTRDVRLARELFLKPDLIVGELIKLGATLSDDRKIARKQVQAALRAKSQDVRKVTSRPGWHDEDSIVYPGKTFGAMQKILSYEPMNDDDDALGLTAGSLDDWREGLRAPCEASDYLILTISHKAASALLEIIGQQEGMLLHLHGANATWRGEDKARSSSGKSLATRVAASMTGRCRKNDLLTFAITERAVEDHCYGHNSLGIEFDEEGRSFAGKRATRVSATQLGYIIASGRGGVRSTKATRDINLKNRRWVLNAISSGELPLDDRSVRSARAEGEQVRMIGLPVPPGRKGGIYNRVEDSGPKMARCAALARQTELTIATNYGVAFPAFIEKLVSSRDGLATRIIGMIEEFVRDVGADGSPWERRFAEKFGLAYSAAVLLKPLPPTRPAAMHAPTTRSNTLRKMALLPKRSLRARENTE